MKVLKYFLSTLFVIAAVWSCTDEEFGSLDFIETATAPTNVAAVFKVTQDNTGLVSITPSAEGATQFEVDYGDGTATPGNVMPGKVTTHTYPEGTYTVKIVAVGLTGLETEFTKEIVVSFQAPVFGTEPIVENDKAVSKQVNVTVPDDTQFAMFFDVYFVEDGVETIRSANVGESVSYVYTNTGLYDIKVVLKGGAIETTEFLVEGFEVTEILAPVESAPTPVFRADIDHISIYSDAYTDVAGIDYNPDWGQQWQGSGYEEFDLNGDKMLNYINLSYQGIVINQNIDVSAMEFLHLDVWTADSPGVETSLISATNGEKPVWRDLTLNEWTSIDIPISEFTDQGLTVADIKEMKFVSQSWIDGTGAAGSVFIDNIYFWKEPSGPSPLVGTWMVAPEDGAIAVGPTPDDLSWWYLNQWGDDVTARACWLDDEYVINEDGTFSNVLGAETWLEPWQGVDPEGCGAPIAPHDGSNPATWSSSDTSITVSGLGAYLGLAKVHNSGEDGAPPSNSVTYDYVLSDGGNVLELKVVGYGGTGGTETWYVKLIRKPSPLIGTWKVVPEDGAIAVGPTPDDLSWWYLNQWGDDVTARACWLDDEYVIGADGTFSNVLGSETWLEPWQGVDPEGCGAPIAPHDGSNPATWSSSDTSITVSGLGAYLGLAKVHNTGEDGAPPSNSVTYDYVLSNGGNVLELKVTGYGGTGGTETWYFKLVKQ